MARFLCIYASRLADYWRKRWILQVLYSLPDYELKMFETYWKQEDLNYNINLKSAFYLLTRYKNNVVCQSF